MSEHIISHTIRGARGIYLMGVDMWVAPCKMPYNEGVLITKSYRDVYPTLDEFVEAVAKNMCNGHDGRYLKFYTVHND